MSYFQNFEFIPYRFGDSNTQTFFQNISIYADIFDQVKNNNSFYQKYTIIDGDRPDTLSQKFYGSNQYYWTFFLVNDKIREQGFPLSSSELDAFIKKDKKYDVITFKRFQEDDIGIDDFKNDAYLKNWTSTFSARNITKIIRKNYDLQQVVFDSVGTTDFTEQDLFYTNNLTGMDDRATLNSEAFSITKEYNSVWRYKDADNNFIDIDPFTPRGENEIPITFYEKYTQDNNNLKDIIVIKPDAIATVFEQFQNAVRDT